MSSVVTISVLLLLAGCGATSTAKKTVTKATAPTLHGVATLIVETEITECQNRNLGNVFDGTVGSYEIGLDDCSNPNLPFILVLAYRNSATAEADAGVVPPNGFGGVIEKSWYVDDLAIQAYRLDNTELSALVTVMSSAGATAVTPNAPTTTTVPSSIATTTTTTENPSAVSALTWIGPGSVWLDSLLDALTSSLPINEFQPECDGVSTDVTELQNAAPLQDAALASKLASALQTLSREISMCVNDTPGSPAFDAAAQAAINLVPVFTAIQTAIYTEAGVAVPPTTPTTVAPPPTVAPTPSNITVTVTGSSPALVTVSDGTNESQHNGVSLPYTTTITDDPFFVGVDAQTSDGSPNATISCEINFNDSSEPPVTNTSTGAYAVVTCSS